MIDDAKGRKGKRRRILLVLAVLLVVLACVLVPPYISISRYKSSVTRLISESLGRPVKLSSVEMRLLPRPGFVLTDLTVSEDPAYGAEPVLHANTVKASIRLWPLLRGRMEISRISVDEASMNLVYAGPGLWNLNSILRTAIAQAGAAPASRPQPAMPFPYLEATNSRLNIKEGAEKLPFSILDADLSFWQESSGEWRVRLRGQPARTDLTQQSTDTGTVRLEASITRAPTFGQSPIHADFDWREAQMGQLARFVTGSDPGWRGDVTGQAQVDGTPDAAQVKARLRATDVHRAEFAPAETLDFDANCAFVYHSTQRSIEKLACDSPLGKGLIHVTGDVPGAGATPQLSIALDRVPVAAGLDVLRTIRSGFAPDLEAQGTVSGKLMYADIPAPPAASSRSKRIRTPAPGPLTGTLIIDSFSLSGGGLSQPLRAAKIVLAPTPQVAGPVTSPGAGSGSRALAGTASIAAGGPSPLAIAMRLALDGYQATLRGTASIKTVRDLAHIAGLAQAAAIDNLAGDPITVDMTAQGRWQPAEFTSASPSPDHLSGTLTLHNVNWKADYLANPIMISQALLHIENGLLRSDPMTFSYGAIKGTAAISSPPTCDQPPCPAQFDLQLGDIDASDIEGAFLGAKEPNTLLSTVIARLSPASPPSWPELAGTVEANSLLFGTVTLAKPTATVAIHSDHADIKALDASLLGGQMHATGSMRWAGSSPVKPTYSIQADFHQLSPQAVGRLLGESWTGGILDASAKLDLTGLTGADLAGSAKGTLHFDWKHGAISAPTPEVVTSADENPSADTPATTAIPPDLARFDEWTADAAIANGTITLGANKLVSGPRKKEVDGTLTLTDPPKVQFTEPKVAVADKR